MTSKSVIDNIIAEIAAGGRVMPPVSERIKQRDVIFAIRLANAHVQPDKPKTTPSDKPIDVMDASDYYADKLRRNDNYTMD